MDAIRIARGLTGRDTILKIFGSYHGHHDAVMVAVGDVDVRARPGRHSVDDVRRRLPQAVADLTKCGAVQRSRARSSGASSASTTKDASPRA